MFNHRIENPMGISQRKQAHLDLALEAQTPIHERNAKFNYEPLFFSHPKADEIFPATFLGKSLNYPFWISSMTGGTLEAEKINHNLARLCAKYKLGMGLGSCRPLLFEKERLKDFQLREILGEQPFLGNIGIAQVEELLISGELYRLFELRKILEVDGFIIHINPLQEWLQVGGDKLNESPLITLKRLLEKCDFPLIVKEVGQGFGPRSLKALIDLPIAGIEFGAFGGTNFTLLESLRQSTPMSFKNEFIQVGHSAMEMIEVLNQLPVQDKQFIISGGLSGVLDGLEHLNAFKGQAILGYASLFLSAARGDFEKLDEFFQNFQEAFLVATKILEKKSDEGKI